MEYREDCHHFTGYKPCQFKRSCVLCDHYKPVSSRIAIISLEAMGAVLRTTCLLKPIRRKYPNAHITWFTMAQSKELLAHNPEIDRLIVLSPEVIPLLSYLEFDVVFAVDKSMAAGAIAAQIKAKDKFGFGLDPNGVIIPLNKEAKYQYDVGLDDKLKFFLNEKAETQQITETMALDWQRDPYILELTRAEKEQVSAFKSQMLVLGGKEPVAGIIGFNTGCSELFPYKKLRVTKAIELVRSWRHAFPNHVVCLLGGGKQDHERQEQIKAAFLTDPMVFNSPCLTGLRNGILWLDTADIVFSGCTLGMHMAIGLQKKVVAWFGVSCAQEVDLYEKGVKLKAKVGCSPCWKKSCSNEPKCFDQVDLEEIIQATSKMIHLNQ